MSAEYGINPPLEQVLSEDAVIPPVVGVQVQLLCRGQNSTVTKPPDWRTVIWTRHAGDGTGGQSKLAHQRGESTLPAISRSSLQWIGSPYRPPARLGERPDASGKWGGEADEVILRCPWSFER
ncbi:hypothetical protein VZT92_016221 [Zoarces viviparus]|uniref:Uncharacterized protein n=1 Tax=Zoarces viviparus TaxID=48416 RepID=A0AAW1ETG8_ZOAVI